MVSIIQKYNDYRKDNSIKIKDAIINTKHDAICVLFKISCHKNPLIVMFRIKRFFKIKLNIEVENYKNNLKSEYFSRNEYYKIGVIINLKDNTAKSCMLYDCIKEYTYEGRPFDVYFNVRGMLTELFE